MDNSPIDNGIALYFPGPASFTGEDCAEFQIHGSPAVIKRMLNELAAYPDLQLATPGAFTERAYLNGKLDLTEVEGLADLIAAETELQRQQALAQASGRLSARNQQWRSTLVRARALVEAVLDFSDESDVTEGPLAEACTLVEGLHKNLSNALDGAARAESIRNGLTVVIIGAPNVGKSSLMNRLAARDVAIVTPTAGTTRDTIEVQLELAGMPVTVVDTAGLRDTNNEIEQEGIRRAEAAAANADLVLHLVDASSEAADNRETKAQTTWRVLNKIDLAASDDFGISALTGAGIEILIERLTAWVNDTVADREPALVTRERQRICIAECAAALEHFTRSELSDLELRAEDLRRASHALAQLTGEIDAEDVLDDIFRGFCIGK